MKAVAYIRVSSRKQVEEGTAGQEQEESSEEL